MCPIFKLFSVFFNTCTCTVAQRDYSPIVIFGSLQPLQGSFCFNVTQYLIDDSVVENTEVFTINFIDDTAYSISTVIYITDNDGESAVHLSLYSSR